VVVVVTTDLAVPVDIDSLYWRVSFADDDRTIEDGPFPLASAAELPATLAVIAGSDTEREVRVQLWAYKGMQIRVQRDARLRLPSEGARLVNMSLDWLCSDANSEASCEPGFTCQAGECVDSRSLDNLLQPPGDHACFDVLQCFESMSLLDVPAPGPAGECQLDVRGMSDGSDLNVALIVNTALLGNYGVCRPLGECLIPLDRDVTGGFQTDDGVIALPRAVCSGLRAQVLRIAVARRCPAKSRLAPTCQALDTCAAFDDELCQADWPLGYSCSGSVTPFGLRPDLVACREAEPEAPTAGPLYCCTPG
jgi:hypothetical protein